jgi:glycosyltransferase involved in cell wall biosynthesis
LSWHKDYVGAGLLRSDAVIAPTGAFARALSEMYRLPKLPAVVHSGRRPSTRESLPDGHAVPTTCFAFTAGRLWDEGKNLATLDAAASRIDLPVYAAGPLTGPTGASIELNHLHALGPLSEGHLAEWLAAKPIFVSTACYEPFGPAVLEAAEAGCALVLSDIPTFRELWEGAAEFVPCDDSGSVAAAIELVANDSGLRTRLASAARRRARRYTAEVMAAKMRAIYGGLLRKTTRQRSGSEVAA